MNGQSNKGNLLSVDSYIGGHGGHVNLDVVHKSRLTRIKQRLIAMVQNHCWLCGADLLMPNRVEMSPRGFIVQGFAKILFLQKCEYMQEKMQKNRCTDLPCQVEMSPEGLMWQKCVSSSTLLFQICTTMRCLQIWGLSKSKFLV